MYQSFLPLKRALAVGAVLSTVALAPASIANTPRGSNGVYPGSESVPPSFPPKFQSDIVKILRGLRSGNPSQKAIADILESTGRLYRYNETVGELRATVSQPAVPPNEPGIEQESPGFVRLDLKRDGSVPGNVAARFARYVDTLGNQNGRYRIFGNDRRGVTRDIRVEILPKSDGQVELRFMSDSSAMKDASGKPKIESIIAPNSDVAAVLAGVLSGLDVANASSFTLETATKMVLSLGDTDLSLAEVQQLAQGLTESLIASEALFAGCGKDTSVLSCTNLNMNALRMAIQSYNKVVNETSGTALIALSKNPEFQTLGDTLRRVRATMTTQVVKP
jgi:hypothetical protein